MRFKGSKHPAYRKPLVGSTMPYNTYFGPDTTAAEMRVVSSLVESLDLDVQASVTVSERFKMEWAKFKEEWEAFLEDNDGVIARSLNQTFALTLEFRDRANDWRKKFIAEGGITSTPALPDSALKRSQGFPWGFALILTGVAGVGYILLRR